MDKPAQSASPSPANPSAESTMAPPSGPLLPNSAPVAGSAPNQTTPGSKPKKKLSVGAIIGGALFLLLAGGAAAGFVFRDQITNIVSKPTPTPTVAVSPSPTPDPTADWETFQGEGFELKYPSDWISGENGTPACVEGVHFYPSTEETSTYTNSQKTCPPSDVIIVYIQNNPKNLSAEKFLLQDSPTATPVIIKVAGIDSIKTTDAPGAVENEFILIPKDGTFYSINWLKGTDAISETTFNQILSTFKFTDNNTTNRYVNKALGFSLTLPEGYSVLKEQPGEIEIGYKPENAVRLIIKSQNLTNYKNIILCSQHTDGSSKECIDDAKEWNQKEPIEKIKLDGIDAVSFYLQGFIDYAVHVVQTTSSPLLEIRMDVAGGGLNSSSQKILSSFKFTD